MPLVPLAPTSQQRKAVEAPLGAVLVVAGPGAGKTFCLIGRIAHLIGKGGMRPERICAVTFTNKAAEEIATRLAETLDARAVGVRRGTIHALCAEVLREYATEAGLKPGFGIADEDYQRTVLRQMGQQRRSGQLLQLFGRRRLQDHALTSGDEQLFREYLRTLHRRNVVDFDDLVVMTRDLFAKHSDVADAVAGRWDYLLVDEFQDVNAVQYALLRRLAEPHGNLFAVGDDEQSIFSWTGADPRVLARFQHESGIAAPIVLDRNHRTSQQIFAVARRLLRGNPSLFDKELTAPRLSRHEVRALGFADDDAEADWIIADITTDRAATPAGGDGPLEWGDYAVLYRRHEVGDRLEARLVKAGVPCRLAKGRPLSDDKVIGGVIAAMRLVRDPTDPSAAEAFARRVLPENLMHLLEQRVKAGEDFLLAVRDLAGELGADPDAKKLWRLVYRSENFAAMREKHATLAGLVQELLAEPAGPYRNVLEERHEDLADPVALEPAVRLAERLGAVQAAKSRIVLEPMHGLEIALRGMLFGAGFKRVAYANEVEQSELDDLRLARAVPASPGFALTLFKALQLLQARGLGGPAERFVTFDLETTGLETTSCEIVEIAGVRVEGGRVAEEFHSLVRPGVPIEPDAQRQHGYSGADLAGAPSFAEVWPRFREFTRGAQLVAHNGYAFDVPVLRRMLGRIGAAEAIHAYDTFPLARALGGGSARLAALAERFGVAVGRAHHALDDARMLVGVYQELERRRVVRSRKSMLVNLLPYLGLAMALDGEGGDAEEAALLYKESRIRALGRFSDCLEFYESELARTGLAGPPFDDVIRRLGGRSLMDRLREDVDVSRRYPEAIARLNALLDQAPGETLDEAMTRFLERVALSAKSEGADPELHRVNLLTLHSTKGLEFSRVYIVGVEDEQLPGWIARDEDPEHATQEARRLLYVGMTRAIERLVLTRVDRRAGRPGGGSRFLEEMQLGIERPGQSPERGE